MFYKLEFMIPDSWVNLWQVEKWPTFVCDIGEIRVGLGRVRAASVMEATLVMQQKLNQSVRK